MNTPRGKPAMTNPLDIDALRKAQGALPRQPVDFEAEVDQATKQRTMIYELRLSGMTLRDIARKYKLTQEEVASIVASEAEEVAKTTKANPAAAIGLSVSRTEQLLNSLWPKALAGDIFCVDRAIRCIERLDKMAGVDDPSRHDVGAGDDLKALSDKELVEYRRLQQKIAAPRKG